MKAAVYKKYGSPEVIQYKDIKRPAPLPDEVLIKIYAAPVNYGDLMARDFPEKSKKEFNMPGFLKLPVRIMFGYFRPKVNILGAEFAGEVENIGSSVTMFKKGDQVFGFSGIKMGANAEYLCIKEKGMLANKPFNMNFNEASTIAYGGSMALEILKNVDIKKGDNVLINGASGAIGSYALQIIKGKRATVTGVCSAPRLNYVKALGADKVIDYKIEDFTKNGEKYDLIFDVLGKSSFGKCKGSLNDNGVYLLGSFKMKHLFHMIKSKIFGGKRVVCAMAKELPQNLLILKKMAEDGIIKVIIDRTFALKDTSEAHKYIESGCKKGQVIIEVSP